MKVGILDYGSGNLHSAANAMRRVGADVTVSRDFDELRRCDKLVVPGVGAFNACLSQLRGIGADEFITAWAEAERPFLGICLGHQIMFSAGAEHGERVHGLGIIPGTVTRLECQRVPHMGWNTVEFEPADVFAGLSGRWFYFVHSYACHSSAPEGAHGWADAGGARFIAAYHRDSVTTTQFHPEKSGAAGALLLRNWLIG